MGRLIYEWDEKESRIYPIWIEWAEKDKEDEDWEPQCACDY